MASEKLPLGLAARLSRYLQILMQAQKAGRVNISSKALSRYSAVNPTQIRRDLSAFGKLGKRGVGYDIDFLVAQIKEILRSSGRHNIALVGAGNLGTAIATSDIFNVHGLKIAAIFDTDPAKVGRPVGELLVKHFSEIGGTVYDQGIVIGILATPVAGAQMGADALVAAGVKLIFNYSDALIDAPPGVTVHPMSPAGELVYAMYSHLS